MTTAASLWVVGCLGLAIGQGYYTIGILGGVSVVLILVSLKKFESRFILSNELVKIYMEYKSKNKMASFMEEYFTATGIKIKNIEFYVSDISGEFSDRNIESCLMTIKLPKSYNIEELILKCSKNENIIKINEVKD